MSRYGIYDEKYGFAPDDDCLLIKPQTMADHIRSLNDKELAEFLHSIACVDCPFSCPNDIKWNDGVGQCESYWLNWLQSKCNDQKKGHWTFNKDGSGTCSECGRKQYNCWDQDDWDNFCHFCGADMRGERWTQIMCKKCEGKRFIARGDIVVCDKCDARMDGVE